MKKNSVIIIFGILLIVLISIALYFVVLKDIEQPIAEPSTPQVSSSDTNTSETPEQIVYDALTPEQKATNPEITIINATDNYIKANLFFNPGGHYILVARVNGEWEKALEGNSIPECKEIIKYNFPKEIVPNCLDNGQLIETAE